MASKIKDPTWSDPSIGDRNHISHEDEHRNSKSSSKPFYHSNHPAIVFPLMGAWAILGGYMCSLPLKERLIAFYFGVLWETWLEFSVHRWVLHFPLWWPLDYSPRTYYVTHGHHHVYPKRRQFFPLLHNQLLTFGSLAIFKCFMSDDWMWGVSCGGASGLMLFELVHSWIHRGINQWWLKPMETYHIFHHQKNKNVAYGFVMPMWDLLFGCAPENFPYTYLPLPIPVLPFIGMAIIQEFRGGPGGHLVKKNYVKPDMHVD